MNQSKFAYRKICEDKSEETEAENKKLVKTLELMNGLIERLIENGCEGDVAEKDCCFFCEAPHDSHETDCPYIEAISMIGD